MCNRRAAVCIAHAAVAAAVCLSLWATGARAAAPEPPPEVGPDKQYVKFYMGEVLVKGWVMEVDVDGERFDFYDAMARAEIRNIPFKQLPPPDRQRLRSSSGAGPDGGMMFPESTGGEIIKGIKIYFEGGPPIVGLELVEMSTKNMLYIRRKSIPFFSIPRDKIVRIEPVEVRETDIYSTDYLYQRRLDLIDAGSGSDNYELAEYLRCIGDYVHAREHYERAKLLDPRIETQAGERIAEAELIIQAQVVGKMDKDISGHVRAGRLSEALRTIERLGKIDPNSGAYNRWMARIGEIEKELSQNLRRDVVSSYYRKMDELIRRWAWGRVTDGPDIPGKIVSTTSGTFTGRLVSETEETEESEGTIVLEVGGREIRIDKSIVKRAISINLNKKKRDPTFAESREYVTNTEGGLTGDIMNSLTEQYGELIIAHKASQSETEGEWQGEGEPETAEPEPVSIFDPPEAEDVPGEEPELHVETVAHEDVKAEIRGYWEGRLRDIVKVTEKGTVRVPLVATQHSASWGIGSWLREGAEVQVALDGADAPDPERWWRSTAGMRDLRYQMLRAVAAEALCKVDRVARDNCSNCGGKGYVAELGALSRASGRVCPVCRGVGAYFVVKYR